MRWVEVCEVEFWEDGEVGAGLGGFLDVGFCAGVVVFDVVGLDFVILGLGMKVK